MDVEALRELGDGLIALERRQPSVSIMGETGKPE